MVEEFANFICVHRFLEVEAVAGFEFVFGGEAGVEFEHENGSFGAAVLRALDGAVALAWWGVGDDLGNQAILVHPDEVERDADLIHPIGKQAGLAVYEKHAAAGREGVAEHHPAGHVELLGDHLSAEPGAVGQFDVARVEIVEGGRFSLFATGGKKYSNNEHPICLKPHPLKWYRKMFFQRLRMTLDMIKFEHSIFALPFALTGALLAWRDAGFPVEGAAWKLAWIVVAMVGARSAGMAFNRILDADIDGMNPRTRTRHLPAGVLSTGFAWGFLAVMAGLLVLAAGMLGPLCLWLSPVALGIVMGYSYTKRFTSWSHVVLGFALGIAPAAAWIAVEGALDARILWLTAAVTFWTAGFDIIYSCQDFDFDRGARLYSVPKRLGIAGALTLSRLLHLAMLICLVMLLQSFSLGLLGAIGVGIVALLLVYEHSLVKADDLSRVNAAFFTVNGYVSVLFFVFWAADVWYARRGV